MIEEGKTPQEKYDETGPYETSEYRILRRMKEKYVKVIDFYTEAKKEDQVDLGKKEMQEVLRILFEVETIYGLDISEKEDELGGLQSEKIQKRVERIKIRYFLFNLVMPMIFTTKESSTSMSWNGLSKRLSRRRKKRGIEKPEWSKEASKKFQK